MAEPLSLLHRAAWSGEAALLEAGLGAREPVDALDAAGFSPLAVAAAAGRHQIVQSLLAAGADPNRVALDGCTPLVVAAASGHRDVARSLLAAGAEARAAVDRVHTAVRRAAWRADGATIAALVEGGAELSEVDAALFLLRSFARAGTRVTLLRQGSSWTGMWDHDDDPPHTEPDVFAVDGPLALPEDAPPALRRLVRAHADALCVGEVQFVTHARQEGETPHSGYWLSVEECTAGAERLSALLHGRSPAPGELDELGRWAAERGYTAALEALVALGLSAGCLVEALAAAARAGRLEAVEVLLRAGAGPNASKASGLTPLHAAADAYDDGACLRALLAAGGDARCEGHPMTPLHLAADRRTPGATVALLAAGADAAARDREGRTPLHVAAAMGGAEVVKALLAVGAPVDAVDGQGRTALHVAAGSSLCAAEVVGLLLEAGANLEAPDARGRTPVVVAIEAPRPDATRVLLEAGARGDARDGDGRTPIMSCVRWTGTVPDIERLLAQGGEINAADRRGETALMHAVRHGNYFVLADLLRLGARAELTNRKGQTALDLAREQGKAGTRLVEELQRALRVSEA
ncbi:MAG: ankyrin repeat domain-containing protein [Deltaproteobacteria bacterium]|nr:ankyrin repeat domain-containing protein [Deltaproteobacteria bacterium]